MYDSISNVPREYLDQHKVVIVCSARSGSTKALGTTNLLLRAAGEALKRENSASETPGTMSPNGALSRLTQYSSPFTSPGKSSPKSESIAFALGMTSVTDTPPTFNTTVDVIRSEHVNAARSAIRNPEILKELEAEFERDCESLRSFLFATQVCAMAYQACVAYSFMGPLIDYRRNFSEV